MNATAERRVDWGHWGITFYYQTPGQYAPDSIEGTIYFPVGALGPADGFIGSPERASYLSMCRDWQQRGILPAGLRPSGS